MDFIVIIRYYSESGHVLLPFMVQKSKDCDVLEFQMRVSPENIKGSEHQYTDYQKKIGELSYRCENLLKKQLGNSTDVTDRMVEQILDLCIDNS